MTGPPPTGPPLPRAFFARPALTVAPELLGAVLRHQGPAGVVSVRLTEVEAYGGPGDPGSHARRGPTVRTAPMFGPPGHLYVYLTYGMHWCANVVCASAGEAAAVLLRAGEVVEGVDLARARRPSSRHDDDLARGPARLAAAAGLGREQDGADACATDGLCLRAGAAPAVVGTGPRTGVSGPGGDGRRYPWRFWVAGERTVSPYRPAVPRARPAG